MEYTIIEDCSPFYIRFTWDGLLRMVDACKKYPIPSYSQFGYGHIKAIPPVNETILKMLPASNQMHLNPRRVSFLVTEPGFYYGAHKDGLDHRFSLNIGIQILDDKCVTSWYSDKDLKDYEITTTELPSVGPDFPGKPGSSREILNWNKDDHQPIKTMTARPNEAVLFNTEIFHTWDNSLSTNRRILLTFRHETPGKVYFEDARKIMFGY